MCDFGVACQTHIPAPTNVSLDTQYGCVCNTQYHKFVLSVWCAERTYLYTGNAKESVAGYFVWVYLNCTVPKMCGSGVARRMHTPLGQKCEQNCMHIPSMGVFEMRSAKKCGFIVWCAGHTYICSKGANKSVLGYLVWVCLKCTMPTNPFFFVWSIHTSSPKLPTECLWIPSVDVFEMHSAKKCMCFGVARRSRIPVHNTPCHFFLLVYGFIYKSQSPQAIWLTGAWKF